MATKRFTGARAAAAVMTAVMVLGAVPVMADPAPSLSVVSSDSKQQYYQITISDYTPSNGVSFAVWSDDGGQDDLRWYDSDGVTATMDVLDHNSIGTYYVHCYAKSADGSKTYVTGDVFSVSALPTFSKALSGGFTDATQTDYNVTVSDIAPANGLRAAVWSDAGGQDDLKWYSLNKTAEYDYSVDIDVPSHRSAGTYQCHVYDGNTFVDALSFNVDSLNEGTLAVEAQDYDAGTAKISVNGVASPSGVASVKVAAWSTSSGSDMRWYDAVDNGSGSWIIDMNIANHGSNWANYNVHAYATDGNNIQKFAGAANVDFSVSTSGVSASADPASQKYTVEAKDVTFPQSGSAAVLAGVWSEANGQDDFAWREMTKSGSNYVLESSTNDFKSLGKCQAHVYARKADGTMVYIGATDFTLAEPVASSVSAAPDKSTGKFTVDINGVSSDFGLEAVRVGVWCKGVTDDMHWYNASKVSDGQYKVSNGNISNHKYNTGNYSVHVYIMLKNGQNYFVGATTMDFSASADVPQYVNDPKETKYQLSVDNVSIPAGAKAVEFAVWCGSANPTVWYKASESAGTNPGTKKYTVDVPISDFKKLGQYTTHIYVTTKSGSKCFLTGGNVMKVSGKPSGTLSVPSENGAAGKFNVQISGLSAPSGINNVQVCAWPSSNSSKFYWYTAKKQGDGSYVATVDVSKHGYELGKYDLHVYTTMGNGIKEYTVGGNYTFNPSNFCYAYKSGNGKRTIVLKNATASNVIFYVWPSSNSGSMAGISGSASGSTVCAVYDANQYAKASGEYTAHAYSGGSFLAGTKFSVEKSELVKNGWYYENFEGHPYKFYYINGVRQTDIRGIIGPQGSYRATVNRACNTVTIFASDGGNGYIIPVCSFACSVGLPGTPTDPGTYYTSGKWRWKELMGPSWGQYATRIYPSVYFHSVAGVNTTSYNLNSIDYNNLGQAASHGCVRLCVRDAKWIYDNCQLGMQVTIYDSGNPGPMGKPGTIKIPAGQTWDPTDPNL